MLLDAGGNAGARNEIGWTARDELSISQDGGGGRLWAALLAAERKRSVAFAMGHHERLGSASWVLHPTLTVKHETLSPTLQSLAPQLRFEIMKPEPQISNHSL